MASKPILLRLVAIILLLCVVFAFFAKFGWFFEVFSHFAWQYFIISAVLFIVFLFKKKTSWMVMMLGIWMSQAYIVKPLFIDNVVISSFNSQENIKILQYNLNHKNRNIDEITRWIISQSEDVDVVVLMEVTEAWEGALQRISWAYPYHINNNHSGWRGTVVFSKMLIDEMEVKSLGKSEDPVIVMRGETTSYDIPFVLYAVHPMPPISPEYAKRRDESLRLVAQNISEEKIHNKILIGDFNATIFSPILQDLMSVANLMDSNAGKIAVGTWPLFAGRLFGIAIDNVFISKEIEVLEKNTGPDFGSDHAPIVTRLRLGK